MFKLIAHGISELCDHRGLIENMVWQNIFTERELSSIIITMVGEMEA
jgi:hypothetical protein